MRALFLSMLLAAPAAAETRTVAVTSFERVRVEGAFDVRVTAGGSPRAGIDGDPRALDRVEVSLQGTTLIVRPSVNGWGEQHDGAAGGVTVVTLSTPALRAASVSGGGKLTVAGMAGQRLDVSVNGAGAVAATDVTADELDATLIGSGTLTLAGSAHRARLLLSGSGSIDAAALQAGDLVVRQDGTGITAAAARYTAAVTTTGLGAATVTGHPACTVKALAGGPVRCGGD